MPMYSNDNRPGSTNNLISSSNRTINLIGAATSRGCLIPGCEQAPEKLLELHLTERLKNQGINSHWQAIHKISDNERTIEATAQLGTLVSAEVNKALSQQQFFAVIGGDHSCAIGTWSGIYQARQGQPFGLIWIDAHMDSHTPHSSHSGALHGMPLACLLGFGPPSLVQLSDTQTTPVLNPDHLCVLGVRSYESEEAELLDTLGVRVITMAEIQRLGIAKTMQEAITIASRAGEFGLSFDLDALDPSVAPGVSTPVPDGINESALNTALTMLAHTDCLLGVEIAEFNPLFDQQHKTAHLIGSILAACTPTNSPKHGVSS